MPDAPRGGPRPTTVTDDPRVLDNHTGDQGWRSPPPRCALSASPCSPLSLPWQMGRRGCPDTLPEREAQECPPAQTQLQAIFKGGPCPGTSQGPLPTGHTAHQGGSWG